MQKKVVLTLFILMISLVFVTAVLGQENTSETNGTEVNDTEMNDTDNNTPEDGENDMDKGEDKEPEEKEEIDEETEHEIRAIHNGIGAKMRALQLQRAINRRVLWSKAVIAYIKENIADVETGELEALTEELRFLAEDAGALAEKEVDDNLVREFIDIKTDSKKIIKEFRTIARGILSQEDITALRKTFLEIDKTELKEITKQIRQLRRKLNAQRVRKALEKMGKTNEELIQRIENGEIDVKSVLKEIRTTYRSLTPAERAHALTQLKQDAAQKIDLVRKRVDIFHENQDTRAQARRLGRADALRDVTKTDVDHAALRERADDLARKRTTQTTRGERVQRKQTRAVDTRQQAAAVTATQRGTTE